MLAKQVRGAAKVIVIDSLQYRLDHVSKHVPGVETINRKEHKVGTFSFRVGDYQDSETPCQSEYCTFRFQSMRKAHTCSLNVCVSADAGQPLSRLEVNRIWCQEYNRHL
jgi:hypothetical protein